MVFVQQGINFFGKCHKDFDRIIGFQKQYTVNRIFC